MATFREMLQKKWDEGKFVCVGLDSDPWKIPSCKGGGNALLPGSHAFVMREFNLDIIETTADLACAYKPNLAFYIGFDNGMEQLQQTVRDVRHLAPGVPVILDAKDMDIGNTNVGYVRMALTYCGADAITVNPYLGMEAAESFLEKGDLLGVIVLCRTSNPGAGEFQDLIVNVPDGGIEPFVGYVGEEVPKTIPFWSYVAYRVSRNWNKNRNCALVVGATYPEELREVRRIVGDMPILIPGIGAQGGDVEATVKAGMDSRGQGMIINSSRGIIFASNGPDFAEAARRETIMLNELINQYRN